MALACPCGHFKDEISLSSQHKRRPQLARIGLGDPSLPTEFKKGLVLKERVIDFPDLQIIVIDVLAVNV